VSSVDYDDVAAVYDRRYAANRFDGLDAALTDFVGSNTALDVAEVGCGTGHWLAALVGRTRTVIGIDMSERMLRSARAAAPLASLVRGCAEALPCREATVDRLFAINAFHHFVDKRVFLAEARRVLRPGGALMTIGLDPHTGVDQWWVYDYFPAALAADRERYPPTATIREWLAAAGFRDASTSVAQHIPAVRPFDVAVEQGIIDRLSASQLMVISDADYEAGRLHLEAERPTLRADLRLYMTTAFVPSA
jgi:ubiquinone/menaquinone biosynthesis C-methylase UbiE